MYHSIDDSHTLFSTSPATFRSHLRFLKQNGWTTLTAPQYIEAALAHRSLPRAVFLTFDDGYQNLRETAAPILEEFGFTATVFVLPDLAGSTIKAFLTERNFILTIVPPALRHGADEAMRFAASLPLMTWDHIADVSARGFDVQSHSCAHHILTRLKPDELQADMIRSREELQRRLAKPVDMLCYPYGDRNARVIQAAKDAGYRAAVVANRFGVPGDPMQLSRIGMSDLVSAADLAYLLSDGAEWEANLRRRLSRSAPAPEREVVP